MPYNNYLKSSTSSKLSPSLQHQVRQARDFESRELEWEHREVDLERMIANMERMQAEVAGAANQFESAVGALPDKGLPVAEQLEMAVNTIKGNVKHVMDAKAEAAFMKKVRVECQTELEGKLPIIEVYHSQFKA